MNYFQEDYGSARERFIAAAESQAFRTVRLKLASEDNSELYLDFAMLKRNPEKLLLHLSGVHGIEGYAGSAIQSKILSEPIEQKDHSLLFIHGINPYGMAYFRRTNANNVDLNRNFLKSKMEPNPDYSYFQSFLSPSSKFSYYATYCNFIYNAFRLGRNRTLNAIAGGQNSYPDGLFFAGASIQREILQIIEFLRIQFPQLKEGFVIDVHTGLGRRGQELLFMDTETSAEKINWAKNCFAREIDFPNASESTYQTSGKFSDALRASHPNANWHYFLQEFGTNPAQSMLNALRAENFAWKHRAKNSKALRKAGQNLYYAFNPKSETWRKNTLELGALRFNQLHRHLP